MKGKRHDLTEGDEILEQGEYGKYDKNDTWYARPPQSGFTQGNLAGHKVVEHEDGTITVSPSILITGHHGNQWHGYLERGVWRQV